MKMLNRYEFTKLVVQEIKKSGILKKRDCTISLAYKFIRCYQKAVLRALDEYGGVKFRNWGTYTMNVVPGGELENPQTGQIWEYEESVTPKFKFSKTLARRLEFLDDYDDILGEKMRT